MSGTTIVGSVKSIVAIVKLDRTFGLNVGEATNDWTRFKMSMTAGARARACGVGSIPLGCRTNSGSLNRFLSRPKAWLVADCVSASRVAARPT